MRFGIKKMSKLFFYALSFRYLCPHINAMMQKSFCRICFTVLTALLFVLPICANPAGGGRNEKLWLHRCLSLEKANAMAKRFRNIEVDVCLRQNGQMDVTHDADTTFNLDFSDFLAYIGLHPERKIWVDVKNLSEENAADFLRKLEAVMEREGVKRQQLIIESPRYDLLRSFTGRGFYTSCYVAVPRADKLSRTETDSILAHYEAIALSGDICALSFPGHWYKAFSKKYRALPIDLLTWEHHKSKFRLRLSCRGRRMLRNPQLKVILVKKRGRYHR